MLRTLLFTACLIALPACSQQASTQDTHETLPTANEMPGPDEGVYPSMMKAGASLIGQDGSEIGQANLLSGPNGVLIRIEIAPGGLTPGWHGLHLHAVGTCSDIGVFKESGGHVGKTEGGHGLLNPKGPEAGDLPNIWAAADGSAGYETITKLTSMQHILDDNGTAIIIHAGEDDHLTQPIGGAGARVACGSIG